MLATQKYVRKPFYIDAVQVTAQNIAEVAKWADGEVRTDSNNAQYVKVRVHRPLNDRQTKAFVGDWVLYAGTGFKVYTPKAFANSFEQASVETTLQEGPPASYVDAAIEEEASIIVETPMPKKSPKRA